MTWYALKVTKSREEQTFNFLRPSNLVFLPMIPRDKKRRRFALDMMEPLYEGYVFIWLTEGQDDFEAVKKLHKDIFGFVSLSLVDGCLMPSKIPQNEIDLIKRKDFSERQDYQTGDRVRIVYGPFKDCVGPITRITRRKGVMLVRLRVLQNKEADIKFRYNEVEPE